MVGEAGHGPIGRRFLRVAFVAADEIVARLVRITGSAQDEPASKGPIRAALLNLSEGGACFALVEPHAAGIREGDLLRIDVIRGPDRLGVLVDAELDVRWVLRHDGVDRLAFGCAFRSLTRAQLDGITELVGEG